MFCKGPNYEYRAKVIITKNCRLKNQLFVCNDFCGQRATTIYCGCAGKTGKEQWMRVPYGEELAIHTGLESCVDSRKVTYEALTGGVRAGLP